jgi:hypothetical protein
VIEKGGYGRLRVAGLDAFRRDLASLEPVLADRVGEPTGWDDVSVLNVQVDRAAALASARVPLHRRRRARDVAGPRGRHQPRRAGRRCRRQPARPSTADGHAVRTRPRPGAAPSRVADRRDPGRPAGDTPTHRHAGAASPLPQRVLDRLPIPQAVPAYLLAVGSRPEHVRT